MTASDTEHISQAVRQLWKSRGGLLRSLQPLHLVGYGLVLLGLLDLAESLIPPTLLNPQIVFFLLLPLSVVNTLRIDRQNQRQITAQTEELQAQVDQAKAQVSDIDTEEELLNLVQALSGQEVAPATDDLNVSELKRQITTSIEANEADLLAEAENAMSSRRRDLLEKSVKWNIGTLITGLIYILIWRSTLWARQRG
jgi:hypothetical protein